MKCCSMFPGCGLSHNQLLLLSFCIQQVNRSQDTDVTVSWDKCGARSLSLLIITVTFITICCVSRNQNTEIQHLTGQSTACSWRLPCLGMNYAALFKISLSWTLLSFTMWWCIACEIITSIWGNLLSPSSRQKRVKKWCGWILGQRAAHAWFNTTRQEIHV